MRIALLVCLLSLCFSGCSPAPKNALRIGINAWPGYEFLTLAEQLGYYTQEGVEVKIMPFQTTADTRRAFEKHQIDIVCGTLIEFYVSREAHNVAPVVFMVSDFSNGGDVLLARKAFTKVADLKGKKIGLEIGSVDVLTAANALASAQLSFADVNLVALDQPANIQALLAGEIDAAQTYPPFSTQAQANPDIVRLFDTSQTPGEIVDVLFAHSAALQERKAEFGKIMRAFQRAVDYHQAHPEDATRRMAERENITPAEFTEALGGLKIISAQQQAAYLTQGGLAPLLTNTHRALTAIQAINGPVCGAECFSDVAIKNTKL
ncbi:MAG: hypothetical protein RL497_1515 [Pseudomonadota bacterium]|jgi:NitT/TauT family transport system substrate-binding protein